VRSLDEIREKEIFNNFEVNDQIFVEKEKKGFIEEPRIVKEEPEMKKEKETNSGYKLSKDVLKIIGLTVSGIFLVLSILTGAKSFVPAQKTEELILSYNASSTADYRVNLVENDFYEFSSLGKGELVPVTFIKDIEIDFASYLSANKQLDINYNYRVTGEITATASDNGKENSGGKIWTKRYTFVEPKSLHSTKATGYNLQEHIVIDYAIYNDLVNQYKLKAAVPMNAVLKVTLTVEADGNVDGTALKESNSVSVNIPLSVSTVLIESKGEEAKPKTLINAIEIPANNNYVLLAISVVIFLGSLAVTLFLLKGLRKMTEDHSLVIKFNKIMRDFNQVIIEIEELPEVKDAAIIEVKAFKDMLDIQKELHLPIMCAKAKDDVLTNNMFYIINQNQIFKYRLNNEQERF
jgi:hypothetical protein